MLYMQISLFSKRNQMSEVTQVDVLNDEVGGAWASLTSWPAVELKGGVARSSRVLLLMGLVF